MIGAKLSAFREALINGAKRVNKSAECDLFGANMSKRKILILKCGQPYSLNVTHALTKSNLCLQF